MTQPQFPTTNYTTHPNLQHIVNGDDEYAFACGTCDAKPREACRNLNSDKIFNLLPHLRRVDAWKVSQGLLPSQDGDLPYAYERHPNRDAIRAGTAPYDVMCPDCNAGRKRSCMDLRRTVDATKGWIAHPHKSRVLKSAGLPYGLPPTQTVSTMTQEGGAPPERKRMPSNPKGMIYEFSTGGFRARRFKGEPNTWEIWKDDILLGKVPHEEIMDVEAFKRIEFMLTLHKQVLTSERQASIEKARAEFKRQWGVNP